MQDRPIVVGVDGTTTALRAVAWAAHEALLRRRRLRLVHAAPYLGTPDDPDDVPRSTANAMLARARTVAHQIAPELTTDVAVLPDPPVSALIDASSDAERLVLGMIGGSGAEIVLGNVTLDVTTGAHCPVTVVRGDSAPDHPIPGPSGAGPARHRVRRRRRRRRRGRLRRRRPPRQRRDRRARARPP